MVSVDPDPHLLRIRKCREQEGYGKQYAHETKLAVEIGFNSGLTNSFQQGLCNFFACTSTSKNLRKR